MGVFEQLASGIQGMMGQLANSVGGLADRLNCLEGQLQQIQDIQGNIMGKEKKHNSDEIIND